MPRWRFWAKNGALALADQGLISVSNFWLTIALARRLGPEQYGAYSMAFAVFLLAASVHHALLLEPMSVLGASRYRERQREYVAAVLWIQAGFGLALTAAMSVATLAAAQFGLHEELVQASWGLTGSAALILLFWLLRGISYLKLAAGPSASAACLYVACLLLGLEVLHARRLLCPATTLLLMAAASTAAAAVLLGRLRLPAAREKGESAAPVGVREVWCEHWGYGRWALAAALASWAPSNICYVLTGGLLGIAYAGALRALLNLVMPVIQTAAALSRLCLPYLSGIAGREGMLATRTPVSRMIWLLAGGASGYWVLVSVFHRSLFEWLYGGRFAEFSHLAPWATLGGVFWTASFCYGLGLRAIQSPFSDLLVQSAAGGVSLLLGVPLIWSLGVSGAVGTLMLSTLAAVAVSTVVFRQKLLRAAAAPG